MNELTFLDLVILKKVDDESSVEKFGTIINTSFFETANLLGTVKIKGFIDIEPSVGGMSKVILTDGGKGILALAEKKAAEPIEPLDNAILHALAGGAAELEALHSALNVRSGDMAYHINKLIAQGFMDFSVRSAKVYFTLTEQGFNSVGGAVKATQTTLVQPEAKELKGAPSEKKEGGKEGDIAHLLKEDEEEKKKREQAHPHHEHEHHEKKAHKRPLSPEEEKQQLHAKRMLSKLEHYVAEYGLWLILIIVVCLIFLGAVYLMLTRGSP
jgi:hypothetical protein